MSSATEREQRRGSRITTRLRVRMVGLEAESQVRPGDLSVSGISFSTAIEPGPPGTIERLEFSTEDGRYSATILACLIRVFRVQSLWDDEAAFGVAFEFLPETRASREAVRTLVEHVARERLQDSIESVLGLDLPGQVETPQEPARAGVRVRGLKQRGLVLETTWPVERGTRVELSLRPPHLEAPLELQGTVMSSQAANDVFRVDVDIDTELLPQPAGGEGDDLSDAIAAVLRGAFTPSLDGRGDARMPYLEGELARVPLVSLMSLLELERTSGLLSITHGSESIAVYVTDGMVIDVEGRADEAPMDALRRAVLLKDGHFKLDARQHERAVRLTMPTHALLLEIARQIDEATETSAT